MAEKALGTHVRHSESGDGSTRRILWLSTQATRTPVLAAHSSFPSNGTTACATAWAAGYFNRGHASDHETAAFVANPPSGVNVIFVTWTFSGTSNIAVPLSEAPGATSKTP